MDSTSRSRKRSFEDQLDNQIKNFEPDNTQRSKVSLSSILEPIPAGDPEQQTEKELMPAGQLRQDEELSGTVAHKSIDRQNLRAPSNRSAGQRSISSYHNMFAVPISASKEYRGLTRASDLDFSAVRMTRIGLTNSVGGGGSYEMQDYRLQIMLLEQQNKNRLLVAANALKDKDTILQLITSLPDRLNIAHSFVKELLANIPADSPNIDEYVRSAPRDIDSLQGYNDELEKKEEEIKTLETKYNELIQMTPEAQQAELLQVRDKAMFTMQQDWEKLALDRIKSVKREEERNGRVGRLRMALMVSRELVPELMSDLIKLAPKLSYVQKINSINTMETHRENYEMF